MSRPLRLQFAGAIYHVTSRGNARQDIVRDDTDRQRLLATLLHVTTRYGWLCHAYCLMDNHYHLLIETPRPNLSLAMRHLNGLYTQAYNHRHQCVGHIFQGRFQAILVEKESHLLELCRYVVLNPVRAGIVKDPALWAWSSYRATAGLAERPAYLMLEWVWAQFGTAVHTAQNKYRVFVAEGLGASSPWKHVQGQIYLGGEGFVAIHHPDRLIREVPRSQTMAGRPSLRKLFDGTQGEEQRILTACRRYGYRLTEVADHLGVHYSTISRRLRTAEAHLHCKT